MATRSTKTIPRVTLLHAKEQSQLLHQAMGFVHQDRDILLHSLLDYCGFLRSTPRFFRVVSPKKAKRENLETFHSQEYLDLLALPVHKEHPHELLASYGLVEDCALPHSQSQRQILWDYCLSIAGASLHGASLLAGDETDVSIHWGGGRHHAHPGQAGGFCYINDIVLAIQRLQRRFKRVLYLDIDIHHADGVQSAFYDQDSVMTVSFHRRAPGFFPSSSGSVKEKGKYNSKGMGFNLNVILPKMCNDSDFIAVFQGTLENMIESFLPEAIVLCVGADGLKGDPLVGQEDGWNLSPEGLAECVRRCANAAKNHKLLILGGGGYNPTETARTFLLATAAACEGARPGMLWNDLPKDIPSHGFFPRYGPEYILVGEKPSVEGLSPDVVALLKDIALTGVYIQFVNEKKTRQFSFEEDHYSNDSTQSSKTRKGPARRQRKR